MSNTLDDDEIIFVISLFGYRSSCRTQVHQWARTSTDIHDTLATDLLLYEFAVAVFMQQTADSLGTHWD